MYALSAVQMVFNDIDRAMIERLVNHTFNKVPTIFDAVAARRAEEGRSRPAAARRLPRSSGSGSISTSWMPPALKKLCPTGPDRLCFLVQRMAG